MKNQQTRTSGLTLFTEIGERKYLSPAERARFLTTASQLENPKHYTFCAMLHWTGCRPSEARAMNALHVDCDSAAIIIGSLKKRGPQKGRHFRTVPVPDDFIALLEEVHDLTAIQSRKCDERLYRLWPYSRTTAWRLVHDVMTEAGLVGVKASAKGLRHAYGVQAAMTQVPITRIKTWLGHSRIETTEIYLDIAGAEDRAIAERMWE